MRDIVRGVSEETIGGSLAGVDEGRASTLLLATDGSPTARMAATYAAGLAHRSGGIVVAVHVIDAGAVPEERAVEAGCTTVEDAKAIVGEWRVRCDTVLADGEPARTVARLAKRVEADCVVLGAGSGQRRPGYMAGTVGDRYGGPVLVVGGDESARGLGRDPGRG